MKSHHSLFGLICAISATIATASDDWSGVQTLVQSSCIQCHDDGTDTTLNLESIDHDLSDKDTYRVWEKIFDRVSSGEMPPSSEDRPNEDELALATSLLSDHLQTASLHRQATRGRVPARRLNKLELGYTLQDLLALQGDLTAVIPDEVESETFDTVGSNQRVSSIHMSGYLAAANQALDRAIQLGPNPRQRWEIDFPNSEFLLPYHDKPINLGGSVTRLTDDGVALFRDADYLLASTSNGFNARVPGVYRITTRANAYQSKDPITLKLIKKGLSGASELLVVKDLRPGEVETIEVTAYFAAGSHFYTTFEEPTGFEPFTGIAAAGGSRNYKGLGIEVRSQMVEGPLSESWPPTSTNRVLSGVELTSDIPGGAVEIRPSATPMNDVRAVVEQFARLAFRRPIRDGEMDPFLGLAQTAIDDGRIFLDAVRVPISSILSSPQFLLFDDRAGVLEDHALANRLSYFLWKSMPDEELFRVAREGTLSDPDELASQIDRLLADPKSERFIQDFVGQWLRLNKVDATSPDETLYPEFDEVLARSIPLETESFFAELIHQNLSVSNLIDSDFTFMNRRLAEHYNFPAVEGQDLRRVDIPKESVRGGVLTQAAVLKTTANGTTTSPVTRGNFVLTNFLGSPPSPPPPGVGSIEPDTRGKTTIREILDAHRDIDTCNQCHRLIDPPGFALESFDPIGGYRENYRATTPPNAFAAFFGGRDTVTDGPVVDASGVTPEGHSFSGVGDYKRLLMEQKDQVAKNFIEQLVIYSTGGQIEFADRVTIAAIAQETRANDYPVRDIIHQIVQSPIFRRL